jgi:hypothetical protein
VLNAEHDHQVWAERLTGRLNTIATREVPGPDARNVGYFTEVRSSLFLDAIERDIEIR